MDRMEIEKIDDIYYLEKNCNFIDTILNNDHNLFHKDAILFEDNIKLCEKIIEIELNPEFILQEKINELLKTLNENLDNVNIKYNFSLKIRFVWLNQKRLMISCYITTVL